MIKVFCDICERELPLNNKIVITIDKKKYVVNLARTDTISLGYPPTICRQCLVRFLQGAK